MVAINSTNRLSQGNARLSGNVALVTGGSRGIGRAVAHRLAVLGASVAICGRDHAALEESASEAEKLGTRVYRQVADVTRPAEIAELVAKTEA